MENTLYYGDNLDILKRYIPDESIDLIYLDPPFNSNQSYNILFKEHNGTDSAAQIKVFEDTWHWDQKAEETYREITKTAPQKVIELIEAIKDFLGRNDMMAYLVMMTIRLVELRRVLKNTGSIYLHCDPTASHYLKLVMDSIFGVKEFRNEIIWKRSAAHSDTKQGMNRCGRIHDTILFYTRSDEYKWNTLYTPYDEAYIKKYYRHIEKRTGRRYQLTDLTANKPGGDTLYEFMGVKPKSGRIWAYSKENMYKMLKEGRIVQTAPGRMPRYKRYLDEMPGVPLQDIWIDIRPIHSRATERLGFPTQKPNTLLERIIKASSNEVSVVLDPFCGCGTTITVAEKLKRKWIGIDVTHLAISLMKHRLKDTFGDQVKYDVIGEPVDKRSADALAKQDRYQFEWWALGLVGARPADDDKKKGGDKGIDGIIYFHDEPSGGKAKKIIIQVKSGNISPSQIRDLKGVVERDKAQIGVFITLKKPTSGMIKEALEAGYYHSKYWNKDYPKIQILTVDELLAGKEIAYPKTPIPHKKAQAHEPGEQKKLDME